MIDTMMNYVMSCPKETGLVLLGVATLIALYALHEADKQRAVNRVAKAILYVRSEIFPTEPTNSDLLKVGDLVRVIEESPDNLILGDKLRIKTITRHDPPQFEVVDPTTGTSLGYWGSRRFVGDKP